MAVCSNPASRVFHYGLRALLGHSSSELEAFEAATVLGAPEDSFGNCLGSFEEVDFEDGRLTVRQIARSDRRPLWVEAKTAEVEWAVVYLYYHDLVRVMWFKVEDPRPVLHVSKDTTCLWDVVRFHTAELVSDDVYPCKVERVSTPYDSPSY
jgi:hypothetical protein